jgi:hypothetical protein
MSGIRSAPTSRPVERLACIDTHLCREDHRFTMALIFPQQVEEANSRSWQNSGTLSIHTRKERTDQKPSHATIPLKYNQDHCLFLFVYCMCFSSCSREAFLGQCNTFQGSVAAVCKNFAASVAKSVTEF